MTMAEYHSFGQLVSSQKEGEMLHTGIEDTPYSSIDLWDYKQKVASIRYPKYRQDSRASSGISATSEMSYKMMRIWGWKFCWLKI